jgi:hypothetical protein
MPPSAPTKHAAAPIVPSWPRAVRAVTAVGWKPRPRRRRRAAASSPTSPRSAVAWSPTRRRRGAATTSMPALPRAGVATPTALLPSRGGVATPMALLPSRGGVATPMALLPSRGGVATPMALLPSRAGVAPATPSRFPGAARSRSGAARCRRRTFRERRVPRSAPGARRASPPNVSVRVRTGSRCGRCSWGSSSSSSRSRPDTARPEAAAGPREQPLSRAHAARLAIACAPRWASCVSSAGGEPPSVAVRSTSEHELVYVPRQGLNLRRVSTAPSLQHWHRSQVHRHPRRPPP